MNLAQKSSKYLRYIWNRFAMQKTIDSSPTFIVGCGHSGTSVLLAILGAHPRIYPVTYESGIAKQDNKLKFQEAVKIFGARLV